MELLLTTIITWLSLNFGLPEARSTPEVAFLPAAALSDRRYGATAPDRRREVLAIYDASSRTIFLADDWRGRRPAETSVLVHEVVHYLQDAAGMTHECGAAREQLAYAAQDRWLRQFGTDLETEFEVDLMTLKVLSACWAG